MAKKIPVTNWVIKQSPSKEPKFHQIEMFEGEGKSTKELLAILIRGWCFRKVFIIFFLFAQAQILFLQVVQIQIKLIVSKQLKHKW